MLKPATHGVGVFATHDIAAKTSLRLFSDTATPTFKRKKDIPEIFRQYCVDRGSDMLCPKDFGRMEVGWYLNHSKTPNAHFDYKKHNYYSLRDIKAGEEITIDYNILGEREGTKDDYYK